MSKALKNKVKLNDVISVKDFGAIGDGVIDDTATITAALAACTGRTLHFPSGNYVLNSPVVGDGKQVVEYEAGVLFSGNTISGVTSFAYHTGNTYSYRVRKSVSAPTTLESVFFTFSSATGDNTNFIGATSGYHVVADNSNVTVSNKPALVGVAYSLRPNVARNLIGVDDVAGVLIQNDTTVSGASGTDATYVGKNGSGAFTNYQFEWVTGHTVAANCGYPFRVSSSSFFCGMNIAGKMIGSSNIGYGLLIDSVIYDTVTNRASIFRSEPSTLATSFTTSELFHFSAAQGAFGAGSSVTTQIGFSVSSNMVGAGTNYGFRGLIPSGANRWNLYMDGTAGNFLAGEVLLSSAATSVSPSSGVSPRLQVTGGTAATSSALIERFTNDANGPTLTLAKSRSTTIGGDTIVQSGDILGTIRFDGNDGDQEILAASIAALVDGTPSDNDMPGRLVFSTTRDGATAVTEALRIDAGQNIIVGDGAVTNAATDGFLYIPSTTSAAPSGVPITYSGRNPMVVDATNSRLYINIGGVWKYAALI